MLKVKGTRKKGGKPKSEGGGRQGPEEGRGANRPIKII